MTSPTCMWCSQPSVALCDAIIGMSAQVGPKGAVLYADIDKLEAWTCDAPMCAQHSHVVGFFCAGKDSSTMDRCPYCLKGEVRGEPMLKEEADALRRKRHAEIRRSQFRLTG